MLHSFVVSTILSLTIQDFWGKDEMPGYGLSYFGLILLYVGNTKRGKSGFKSLDS